MKASRSAYRHEPEPHQEVKLFRIATQMKTSGLSDEFISSAIRTALDYEGVADLVMMWAAETNVKERKEIIADIQDMIESCASQETVKFPCVKLNDLTAVAKDIRQFKDSLLEIVIQKGGLKILSEKTSIPQPSLSRFFNSNSMPRRATLLKIAKALQLNAIQVTTEWAR